MAGNIGTPLCAAAPGVPAEGVIVAEVSAFQLWSIDTFRPKAAALTNLAPDHLDYFQGDWEAYVAAKRRMIENMGQDDALWLPAHDAQAMRWRQGFGGQVGVFGTQAQVGDEPLAMWSGPDGRMWARQGGKEHTWGKAQQMGIGGPHNVRNMLAAAGLARAHGVSFGHIRQAFAAFRGLPHRFETVRTVGGTRFVDDSKATNVHAALAGLRGLEPGYVAIVGGVDKGLELGQMCRELSERAAAVVMIGQLRERFSRELGQAGMSPKKLQSCETMEDAVAAAWRLARRVQAHAVVLSPAASSFDMFRSYAHRGQRFARAVRAVSAPTSQRGRPGAGENLGRRRRPRCRSPRWKCPFSLRCG